MADKIIQLNKTKLLAQGTDEGTGITEITFISESDAIRLFGYVPEIDGSFWWELYELGGSIEGHQRLIYRSSTYRSPIEPSTFTTAGGQLFKLVLHRTGTVSYSILCTGIGAGMAQLQYEKDKDSAPVATGYGNELYYRNQVVSHLHTMNDSLLKILNHLRLVTEVNADEGEKF